MKMIATVIASKWRGVGGCLYDPKGYTIDSHVLGYQRTPTKSRGGPQGVVSW